MKRDINEADAAFRYPKTLNTWRIRQLWITGDDLLNPNKMKGGLI